MSGSKSNYLENAILDHILGGPDFTRPSIVYVALSSALFNEAATGSSFSEITGAGAARVAMSNNSTSWPAASSGQKSNGLAVTFPTATGTWLQVKSFYLLDASSAGNILYGGDLVTPRDVLAGDTPSFAPNTLIITED